MALQFVYIAVPVQLFANVLFSTITVSICRPTYSVVLSSLTSLDVRPCAVASSSITATTVRRGFARLNYLLFTCWSSRFSFDYNTVRLHSLAIHLERFRPFAHRIQYTVTSATHYPRYEARLHHRNATRIMLSWTLARFTSESPSLIKTASRSDHCLYQSLQGKLLRHMAWKLLDNSRHGSHASYPLLKEAVFTNLLAFTVRHTADSGTEYSHFRSTCAVMQDTDRMSFYSSPPGILRSRFPITRYHPCPTSRPLTGPSHPSSIRSTHSFITSFSISRQVYGQHRFTCLTLCDPIIRSTNNDVVHISVLNPEQFITGADNSLV